MIPQPIDQVPLFLRLSEEERQLVTARLRRRQVAAGQVVFTAGHPSDALYVITSGWVKLEQESNARAATLANLGASSLLGEMDTLLGNPYSTTARAAANTQLLALSRTDVQDLISQHPGIGLKFSATLGTRVAFLEQYLTQQRLRNISLLSGLSEDDLRAVAEQLDLKSYSRGEIIVEAGAPGQAAYFVEEGHVRLITTSSEGEDYEDLTEGDLFGHTALITGKPFHSTARAVTDASVWHLSRPLYLDLIGLHPAVKLAFSRSLAESLGPTDQNDAADRIRQLPLFSDVPAEALSALVARLVLRHFPTGEVIYAEGTPGDALYIVESGEVKLMDCAFSDARLLERMRAGESFGEMALLTGRTRAECARAANDATVWVLYKTDFDDLMVTYPEISVSLSRALTERLGSREDDFLERHLRRISLLSNLASSELRALAKKVRGLRFRTGEIICFAGQRAETVYMIENGEVKRLGIGPGGEPRLIDLLGPGDSFGEQSVTTNGAYLTTAQAIGEVELWTIAKDDFLAMLEQFPTLALTITRRMSDRQAYTGGMPGARYAPPPGSTPQGGAPGPQRGPAPGSGYAPGRGGATPPPQQQRAPIRPGSRIQRPLSGARPIPKPTPPQPVQQEPIAPEPQQDRASQPFTGTPSAGRVPHQQSAPVTPRAPSPVAQPAPRAPRTPQTGATSMPAQARPGAAPRPRRQRNQFLDELIDWLRGLSFGAKFRITALTGLFVWFAFIAIPATAITTVTSAVGGLQIFNAAPANAGSSTPAPNAPVQLTRTTSGGAKPKVAYMVPTETPVPTRTRTPAPTATRRPPTAVPATRAHAAPTAAAAIAAQIAAPAALPTLPPIYWDQRLGNGTQVLPHLDSVRIVPANVAHGQKYWRAVSVKFEDISESGNDHTIYVYLQDENGKRVDGKKLEVSSETGRDPEYPDEKTAADMCQCNWGYPMYGDGYGVQIVNDQYPSDKVTGMIMPMHRHVNYKVILKLSTNP